MTNATAKTSKTDQAKTAIMVLLNTQESATREEINTIALELASSRTISRVLASLKLDGRVNQLMDTKPVSWISLEAPTEKPAEKPAEKKITETEKKTAAIKKEADKLDNTKILATGTEFYATGVEKTGSWTERDLFMMDKLEINYTLDPKETKAAKDEKADKKETPAPKKSDAKADKGTPKTPAKKKQDAPEKDATKDADKKDAPKKITKDNLVEAGKKGVQRNPSTGGPAPKAKPAGEKKPGIIATIIKAITKKHRTKKQILAKLEKAFPDRDASKMIKTVNVQVPSRLRKDKGLEIEKTDKGYKIISK